MALRRDFCVCGAPVLVPPPATRDLLMWAIRAHNDSERHMAWARARIDPSFEVATGYNSLQLSLRSDDAGDAAAESGAQPPVPPAPCAEQGDERANP